MNNLDRYGLFKDNEHISTFSNYVSRIYPKHFKEFDWRYIPANEVGYLFLVAYLFRNIKDINEIDMFLFIREVERNLSLLNEREKLMYIYAQKCLEYEINLNFDSDLEFDDKLLLKIMFDIMSSNYDLIMDKKFIMVSISKDYIESTRHQQIAEDYWIER